MDAIEKGLSLWKQPFDEHDLQGIEIWELSLWNRLKVTSVMGEQNPELYQAPLNHKVVPIKQAVTHL